MLGEIQTDLRRSVKCTIRTMMHNDTTIDCQRSQAPGGMRTCSSKQSSNLEYLKRHSMPFGEIFYRIVMDLPTKLLGCHKPNSSPPTSKDLRTLYTTGKSCYARIKADAYFSISKKFKGLCDISSISRR